MNKNMNELLQIWCKFNVNDWVTTKLIVPTNRNPFEIIMDASVVDKITMRAMIWWRCRRRWKVVLRPRTLRSVQANSSAACCTTSSWSRPSGTFPFAVQPYDLVVLPWSMALRHFHSICTLLCTLQSKHKNWVKSQPIGYRQNLPLSPVNWFFAWARQQFAFALALWYVSSFVAPSFESPNQCI